MRREQREIIALAREFGATDPVKTGSGHWKIVLPNGRQVIISDTGERNTMRAARQTVRRMLTQ